MTTIAKAMTDAEIQYQPSKIKRIARAIWLLLDPVGFLSENTTKAERIEMGVILPADER